MALAVDQMSFGQIILQSWRYTGESMEAYKLISADVPEIENLLSSQ